jgi:hypothetical protein
MPRETQCIASRQLWLFNARPTQHKANHAAFRTCVRASVATGNSCDQNLGDGANILLPLKLNGIDSPSGRGVSWHKQLGLAQAKTAMESLTPLVEYIATSAMCTIFGLGSLCILSRTAFNCCWLLHRSTPPSRISGLPLFDARWASTHIASLCTISLKCASLTLLRLNRRGIEKV